MSRARTPMLFITLSAIVFACACDRAPPDEGPAPTGVSDGEATAASSAICTGQNGERPYSKYKWPFFGDLHLHTAHSIDAYSFGTRALPSDAYLFAKKLETITLASGSRSPGPTIEIDRPLDFLAVTDHSEWMGLLQGCLDPASGYYDLPDCARVRSSNPLDEAWVFQHIRDLYTELCGPSSEFQAECLAEQRSVWLDEQTAAANAYEPCRFSSFVAHEWTNSTGHRNVIFGTDVVPPSPLDALTYTTSKDLWDALDAQCASGSGCRAITPAHNTNKSGGFQFAFPASTADVPQMRRYQKIVEIYQHKGNSECYAGASTTDAECGFEYLSPGASGDTPQAYVRTALENGLSYRLENNTANPLQMGIIGATDDHNATPGHVKESDYTGHAGRGDDDPNRRITSSGSQQNGSGGLTVAWAEQNTRDAIFSAFQRRETYATSGPRIQLRFYQTSSLSACTADFPKTILDASAAVPMGGTFRKGNLAVNNKAYFAISVWPDPDPQVMPPNDTMRVANIEHVQVIKAHGKLDASGNATVTEDPIIELEIDPNGGCIEWTDRQFDAQENAFYYVRVLQEPTWRWTHFDCEKYPTVSGCEEGGALNVTERERAWSSPIWFDP
jgi:uncharacterized protein DUF3604